MDFDGKSKVPESVRDGALKLLLGYLERHLAEFSAGSEPSRGELFRILEIGTACGYSSITMAKRNENIAITSVELNEDRYRSALMNIAEAGMDRSIDVIQGDAASILKQLPTASYDFAFLDGPKGQYRTHFDELCRVVKKGGAICIDNVNFDRAERRYKTINKRMAAFRSFLIESGAAVDAEHGFAYYRV